MIAIGGGLSGRSAFGTREPEEDVVLIVSRRVCPSTAGRSAITRANGVLAQLIEQTNPIDRLVFPALRRDSAQPFIVPLKRVSAFVRRTRTTVDRSIIYSA
ncbi:hypothetical protein FHS96_000028 [Sphingomonas zeicaulis]|uniref:hypothetical protein n=1 Tax=Sphingomonas zeicaulis TaxID=1632740 RepID=UPI003D25C48E